MALIISTWLWGDKYGLDDVAKLAAGLRRHVRQPFRFVLISDGPVSAVADEVWPIHDPELTKMPGCFARLRMFDPAWQRQYAIRDIFACVDLDTVITGRLDPVFDRTEPFVILQGANSLNPCKFNGSLMMLRAGAYPEVWEDFSLEAASKIQFHSYPDDQGWLWHKLPNAAAWHVGKSSGVYAFMKPGWNVGDALPVSARVVVFPGWRSPEKFKHLQWVKANWRT